MHSPDGLSSDVCYSGPPDAAGSIHERLVPGFFTENSNTFLPSTPRQNRVLDLPLRGTGILCQEPSSGRVKHHKCPLIPPFYTERRWGSYKSVERELPMVRLKPQAKQPRLSISVHLFCSGLYTFQRCTRYREIHRLRIYHAVEL
jgi:hypothetical protein